MWISVGLTLVNIGRRDYVLRIGCDEGIGILSRFALLHTVGHVVRVAEQQAVTLTVRLDQDDAQGINLHRSQITLNRTKTANCVIVYVHNALTFQKSVSCLFTFPWIWTKDVAWSRCLWHGACCPDPSAYPARIRVHDRGAVGTNFQRN